MADDDYSYRVNLAQLDDAIATMLLRRWRSSVPTSKVGCARWISTSPACIYRSRVKLPPHNVSHTIGGWRVPARWRENLDELREVARRAHTNYTGVAETTLPDVAAVTAPTVPVIVHRAGEYHSAGEVFGSDVD